MSNCCKLDEHGLDLAYQKEHASYLYFTPVFITGSIARSATRRYLIYSEADFEGFRPSGATRCTDEGEIWHGGASMPNFTPMGAMIRV